MPIRIEWGNEAFREGLSSGLGADRRPFLTPVVSDAQYSRVGSLLADEGKDTVLARLSRECREELNRKDPPQEGRLLPNTDPTRPPAPCLRAYNKRAVVRRECIPARQFARMVRPLRRGVGPSGVTSGWSVGCGGNEIDSRRLAAVTEAIESEQEFTAPVVEVGIEDGCPTGPSGRKFSLGEGNHRTEALLRMGATCIPVIVHYDPSGFAKHGSIAQEASDQEVSFGSALAQRARDPEVQRKQDRTVGAFAIVGIVSALAALAIKQR